jgi:LmbE family N-acetylglucosaminyl deacetylase
MEKECPMSEPDTIILKLPDIERALILAPHPDDEALGCSGTVFLLNEAGTHSSLVFVTNGEKLYSGHSAEVSRDRREEAQRASELLKCRETVFLDFPDGETEKNTEEIYKELQAVIEKVQPVMLFSPSPLDYHQDHITTSKIALRLLGAHRSFRLAFYEVYTTLRFTHLIDITEVVDKKKQIIMNYKSSLYGKPDVYVGASLGLNAHRSIFVQRKGYFEAFHVLEREDSTENIPDALLYR